MKSQSAKEAYYKIIAFIKENGGAYSQWYCGSASDWETRLFKDHQIPHKYYKWWVVSDICDSYGAAKEAEDGLHELGCDGRPGGSDEATRYVYAYFKGSVTDP